MKNGACVAAADCGAGFVADTIKGKCSPCKANNCVKCKHGGDCGCQECATDFFLHEGKCVNTCDTSKGLFEVTQNGKKTCKHCDDNYGCKACKASDSDATTCEICNPTHSLFGTKCVKDCPPKTYRKVANNEATCASCENDAKAFQCRPGKDPSGSDVLQAVEPLEGNICTGDNIFDPWAKTCGTTCTANKGMWKNVPAKKC